MVSTQKLKKTPRFVFQLSSLKLLLNIVKTVTKIVDGTVSNDVIVRFLSWKPLRLQLLTGRKVARSFIKFS